MEPHAFSGARAGYLRHSIYAPLLRLLFEQFGRDRVFIVDAAEFFRRPAIDREARFTRSLACPRSSRW